MYRLYFKNTSDFSIAFIGIIVLLPIMLIICVLIIIDSKGSAIFMQKRVGKMGRLFTIYKFRTMTINDGFNTISVRGDSRITKIGAFLRKYKLDELPELYNIIKGDMSFVGPRPDVPGYADTLSGTERKVLELKPGITGPATLKYANEEELLSKVDDPVKYNNQVIFPDKVKINLEYLENMSFSLDVKLIFRTIFRKNQ